MLVMMTPCYMGRMTAEGQSMATPQLDARRAPAA
jgi:hypothetical protein